MTDSKRTPHNFEDPFEFSPEYRAKVRALLTSEEDIWRIDAEHFPIGVLHRDQTPMVANRGLSGDSTTDPIARAGDPRSSRRRWPMRLVALVGFASVVAGVIITLWRRDNETSSAGNDRDRASFISRLSALVAGVSPRANSSAPHLIVAAAPRTLRSGEAAALGLAVDGVADGAQLVIGGLATGSRFSVGQSIGQSAWRVPASQIEAATIMPPRGFVGYMDIVVTLTLTNGELAGQESLRLEWLPPKSALRPAGSVTHLIDGKQLEALFAHGYALKAIGDLAGARLVFRRAAETGNARAAFMLAETYDPIVLEKLGELGLASDVGAARIWYGKAKELGLEEALGRLERLAHRSD